ncbi:MAG: sodium transporter [Spirochaetales bacterium]|nr:sodium transporter [Spirochaetales bacterium]
MFSLILISVFVALMIAIGIWGMRKTKSLNDFFLGGRSIGPWMSAIAFGTSYFSAVVFIGFAGKLGWGFGLNVLWIALGNALLGCGLSWIVLASRMRRMSQNLDAMTLPEFLHERFGSGFLKIISAIIIFIFLLPYSASIFKGLGHLFELTFNIPYVWALLAMIGITGIYLVLGGYFAITLTDFIQGIIMLVGSVLMIAVLLGKAGGLVHAVGDIVQKYAVHVPAGKRPGLILLISLVFMTSFGTWGLPQMVQKFYAVKSHKVIRTATIITTVFALVVVTAAYFNGALAHLFYDAPPVINGAVNFDLLVPDLLTNQLPDALMAVILLLILSASMSTLSSLVLVSASSIAIDLYKGHINPQISPKGSLALMRALSGVFVIFSFLIALYQIDVIVTLMSLSWGAVAGSFMAAIFYGLYWKGATKAGIIAGIFTGLSTSIILFFVLGPANSPIASSIAMVLPFFIIPAVSAFTKKTDRELVDKAFAKPQES